MQFSTSHQSPLLRCEHQPPQPLLQCGVSLKSRQGDVPVMSVADPRSDRYGHYLSFADSVLVHLTQRTLRVWRGGFPLSAANFSHSRAASTRRDGSIPGCCHQPPTLRRDRSQRMWRMAARLKHRYQHRVFMAWRAKHHGRRRLDSCLNGMLRRYHSQMSLREAAAAYGDWLRNCDTARYMELAECCEKLRMERDEDTEWEGFAQPLQTQLYEQVFSDLTPDLGELLVLKRWFLW